MDSRWHAVVVEAADPGRLGRWWAEVLDYRILEEGADEVLVGVLGQNHPVLSFTRVAPRPGGHRTFAGGCRLRLDVWTDDCDAQVERLVDMGARQIDTNDGADGGRWVVLADPEGNEFRVNGSRLG
jgi:hypothetical protein